MTPKKLASPIMMNNKIPGIKKLWNGDSANSSSDIPNVLPLGLKTNPMPVATADIPTSNSIVPIQL